MGQIQNTEEHTNLKKLFIISLIASLVISALIAIFVFLFGEFGQTEIRIIATTGFMGVFSLTGLFSAAAYDKEEYLRSSVIGIGFSVVGFLIAILGVWGLVAGRNLMSLIFTVLSLGGFGILALSGFTLYEKKHQLVLPAINVGLSVISFLVLFLYIWRILTTNNLFFINIMLYLIVFTISASHMSLMMLLKNEDIKVTITTYGAMFFNFIVACMIVYWIYAQTYNTAPEMFYFRLLGVFAILTVLGTIISPILKKISTTIAGRDVPEPKI